MQRKPNPLGIRRDVRRVRATMENLARRSTKAGLKVMRAGAEAVMHQAQQFAPVDSGSLDSPRNWEVDEQKTGLNRRLTFTVRLRPYARNSRSGKAISRYAAIMHDGSYRLGKRSLAKAEALGLSKFPIGSRQYVGRLYLTRALQNHRLNIETRLRREIARTLQ